MKSKELRELSTSFHVSNNVEVKKILNSLLEAAQKGETGIVLDVSRLNPEIYRTLNDLGYYIFEGCVLENVNDERFNKTSITFF